MIGVPNAIPQTPTRKVCEHVFVFLRQMTIPHRTPEGQVVTGTTDIFYCRRCLHYECVGARPGLLNPEQEQVM